MLWLGAPVPRHDGMAHLDGGIYDNSTAADRAADKADIAEMVDEIGKIILKLGYTESDVRPCTDSIASPSAHLE